MTEQKRGCGWRKISGLYLVGEYLPVVCDKLPVPLKVCPCCGAGIKVGLGMTRINPFKLFGNHRYCADKVQPCWVCQPSEEPAYVMRCGEKWYPKVSDFLQSNQSGDLDTPEFDMTMPCKIETEGRIAIQHNFLLDAIKSFSICSIELTNPSSPMKITGDIEGLTVVIMPLFVQWD